MVHYRENLHSARFDPWPPESLQLPAALRADQKATNHSLLTREGVIPPEGQRIMASASPRAR